MSRALLLAAMSRSIGGNVSIEAVFEIVAKRVEYFDCAIAMMAGAHRGHEI